MLHMREAANRLNRAGPFCGAEATTMGLVLTFQEVRVTIPPTGYLPVRVERREPVGVEAIYVLMDGTRLCRDCFDDYAREDACDQHRGWDLERIEHVPLADAVCANHGALGALDNRDEIR